MLLLNWPFPIIKYKWGYRQGCIQQRAGFIQKTKGSMWYCCMYVIFVFQTSMLPWYLLVSTCKDTKHEQQQMHFNYIFENDFLITIFNMCNCVMNLPFSFFFSIYLQFANLNWLIGSILWNGYTLETKFSEFDKQST